MFENEILKCYFIKYFLWFQRTIFQNHISILHYANKTLWKYFMSLFGATMQKLWKKQEAEKKEIFADRTKLGPASPSYVPPAWWVLCAACPAAAQPRARPTPVFPLYLFVFQNPSLLKYVYLKLYNSFSGSVCLYTFLTQNPSSPTNLPLYI
jgi:hypothetical protein